MKGETELGAGSKRGEERFVYVMPEGSVEHSMPDEIGLRDLACILWRGRWLVIGITTLFAVVSVTYALLATEWYRAEVLLMPTDQESTPSLGSQLGGLAALAGVDIGEGKAVEAVATLKSREFAREFIEDFDLLRVFFSDQWDTENDEWIGDDLEDWPDIRDAVKYFHDNVLSVREGNQAALVTVAIEWTEPDATADWANVLVGRLNERLRQRALRESEANVAYLEGQLAKTTVVTLQQSIGRLLEGELQKLMLARGNEEFAFRVIDEATPPRERSRPSRALICVLGTILGGILSVFAVFFTRAMQRETTR